MRFSIWPQKLPAPAHQQALLSETWQPAPAEPEEGQEPPPPLPSFDPSAAEYNVSEPKRWRAQTFPQSHGSA